MATEMNGKNGANGRVGRLPVVSFAKLPAAMEMPNMLDIQIEAFQALLRNGRDGEEQADVGLERVFNEVFPITDVNDKFSLEFVSYSLGEPKYAVDECIERDMTYAAPLKATLRLVVWEDVEDGERRPKDIIEKEVYLGDLPLLTDLGTFIINGSERVIVSQLHRSPGVVFEETLHPNGSKLYSARIIPFRGSWVEFTVDIHDVVYVHIDKKKKFPATALLRAFGYGNDEDILRLFFTTRELDLTEEIDPSKAAQRRDVLGLLLAEEVADPDTGEIIAEIAEELTLELYNRLQRAGVKKARVFSSGSDARGGESPLLKNTLRKDPTSSEEEALKAIYSLLRPGEPPNMETARLALERIFFNPKRYDLGRVGRYKINQRLGLDLPLSHTVLTQEDFIAIIRYLIELHEGRGFVDDIDHLGNRRIRSVGELIANQFSVGLSRMARLVKERMSITTDVDKMNIDDLVNARTVSAVIQAFFGSSQLSQFMDQTNPLAELTHKRRLSALGPGGLTRERAGFEVRDVHYSHYGRMCPIETPEGPNIGLITSLTTFARINELGFIETPYRRVVDGRVTDEIVWLDANAEEDMMVAQANAPLNPDGTFQNEFVLCRVRGDFPLAPPHEIEYMDVAPDQLVSVAAALIPFLEHDDANRALMGANMQRQAVPLLRSEAPLVGTGMEGYAAIDAGDVVIAERPGVVVEVSADVVTVQLDEGGTQDYYLRKFDRSNQGTSYNQRVVVSAGDRVEAGEVIADGPATENGELALGKNLLVAFMTWEGHNFEDAIILSQNLVKDDTLSSIHIEEYEVDARDTKLGKEEITRDLPNVSPDLLKDLDERGIIRIGAEVRPGDILVGKVTPKGETELSAEERLLRAIFNEKSREVRDTSLKVPHGEAGTIIAVKEFNAEEGDDELGSGVNRRVVVYIAQKRKITEGDKLAGRHGNKGVIAKILPVEDMPFLADGTPVDVILNPLGIPGRMNFGQVLETHLGWIAKQGWKIEGEPEWAMRLPEAAREAAPGTKVATPVFDGASEDEIVGLLDSTNPTRDGERLIDSSGKTVLFDGRSGEPFPAPISVGYMYILKLHHLVDDKIHARSTGPYSMITQQPLGGKAQFGGQRFGEMEVWALEAYGAAYALQELLTIKSDDILGRVKVYEAIVKGENIQEPGIPESFKVLMKEMQSLCLNVEVLSADGTAVNLRDTDDDAFRAAEELGINISTRFESSSIDEI